MDTTRDAASSATGKKLALTAERHDQLAALLNDDQLLQARFPKVAEYFRVASRMPESLGQQVEAAFDLRMLHYMTGGKLVSPNPYWDIVAPVVSEYNGRRVVNGGQPQGNGRLGFAQMVLQATYAYAIPSPETLGWVSQFCDSRQVVELGAGRGYWAAQLSHAGVAVDAFELEPPDKASNISFPQAEGQEDVWYPVTCADGLSLDDCSDRVMLLCWPPGWGNTMASDALAAFELAGGERLVYIGEPKGGKTGNDAFFDALSASWKLASTDSRFVSWWNLADEAQGWVRR